MFWRKSRKPVRAHLRSRHRGGGNAPDLDRSPANPHPPVVRKGLRIRPTVSENRSVPAGASRTPPPADAGRGPNANARTKTKKRFPPGRLRRVRESAFFASAEAGFGHGGAGAVWVCRGIKQRAVSCDAVSTGKIAANHNALQVHRATTISPSTKKSRLNSL